MVLAVRGRQELVALRVGRKQEAQGAPSVLWAFYKYKMDVSLFPVRLFSKGGTCGGVWLSRKEVLRSRGGIEELRHRSRDEAGLRGRRGAPGARGWGRPGLLHGTTLGLPFPVATVPFLPVLKSCYRGTWLAQLMEQVILDLGAMGSRPVLGVETIYF